MSSVSAKLFSFCFDVPVNAVFNAFDGIAFWAPLLRFLAALAFSRLRFAAAIWAGDLLATIGNTLAELLAHPYGCVCEWFALMH